MTKNQTALTLALAILVFSSIACASGGREREPVPAGFTPEAVVLAVSACQQIAELTPEDTIGLYPDGAEELLLACAQERQAELCQQAIDPESCLAVSIFLPSLEEAERELPGGWARTDISMNTGQRRIVISPFVLGELGPGFIEIINHEWLHSVQAVEIFQREGESGFYLHSGLGLYFLEEYSPEMSDQEIAQQALPLFDLTEGYVEAKTRGDDISYALPTALDLFTELQKIGWSEEEIDRVFQQGGDKIAVLIDKTTGQKGFQNEEAGNLFRALQALNRSLYGDEESYMVWQGYVDSLN